MLSYRQPLSFMTSAQIVPAIVVPLVAWRVYLRFKRNVGRQPFQPVRLGVRIGFLTVITLLFVLATLAHPPALAGLAGGVAAGAALAFVGLKLTRFEMTPEGEFYTPNTAIGVGLTLLLVGRVAYRLVALYFAPAPVGIPVQGMFQSPLTLVIFGVSAGYFIAYNTGLLVRGKRLAKEV